MKDFWGPKAPFTTENSSMYRMLQELVSSMRRATAILQIPVVDKICDRLAVKDNLFFDELTSSVSLNYLAFTTTGRQGSVQSMSCRFAFAKTPSMENVKNIQSSYVTYFFHFCFTWTAGGTPGPRRCLVRRRNCSEEEPDTPAGPVDAEESILQSALPILRPGSSL